MATVKIDLGFGEQAILSERTSSGISTAKHQRDAEEFLRRWPRTRSIEQESRYLRQLGLHLGHTRPGLNSSDTSAQLRAAVKSGKVMVTIERAAPRAGGGIGASGPTRRPYPLEMREKTAWAAPARKSYSYDSLPRYDDVSADDLIAYLEDFVSRSSGAVAAPEADLATPLGDAEPLQYSEDSPSGDTIQLAGGEGMPGNNQAQNKQFRAVVKALGLSPDQARRLHDEISGEGLGYHEMLERGQDMFGDIE